VVEYIVSKTTPTVRPLSDGSVVAKWLFKTVETCFQYRFRNGVLLWEELEADAGSLKKNRHRLEKIAASPEEVELSDFLEGLGPQGISEVSLYRLLPSGKQRFITSGPPGQFSAERGSRRNGKTAPNNGSFFRSRRDAAEFVEEVEDESDLVMRRSILRANC